MSEAGVQILLLMVIAGAGRPSKITGERESMAGRSTYEEFYTTLPDHRAIDGRHIISIYEEIIRKRRHEAAPAKEKMMLQEHPKTSMSDRLWHAVNYGELPADELYLEVPYSYWFTIEKYLQRKGSFVEIGGCITACQVAHELTDSTVTALTPKGSAEFCISNAKLDGINNLYVGTLGSNEIEELAEKMYGTFSMLFSNLLLSDLRGLSVGLLPHETEERLARLFSLSLQTFVVKQDASSFKHDYFSSQWNGIEGLLIKACSVGGFKCEISPLGMKGDRTVYKVVVQQGYRQMHPSACKQIGSTDLCILSYSSTNETASFIFSNGFTRQVPISSMHLPLHLVLNLELTEYTREKIFLQLLQINFSTKNTNSELYIQGSEIVPFLHYMVNNEDTDRVRTLIKVDNSMNKKEKQRIFKSDTFPVDLLEQAILYAREVLEIESAEVMLLDRFWDRENNSGNIMQEQSNLNEIQMQLQQMGNTWDREKLEKSFVQKTSAPNMKLTTNTEQIFNVDNARTLSDDEKDLKNALMLLKGNSNDALGDIHQVKSANIKHFHVSKPFNYESSNKPNRDSTDTVSERHILSWKEKKNTNLFENIFHDEQNSFKKSTEIQNLFRTIINRGNSNLFPLQNNYLKKNFPYEINRTNDLKSYSRINIINKIGASNIAEKNKLSVSFIKKTSGFKNVKNNVSIKSKIRNNKQVGSKFFDRNVFKFTMMAHPGYGTYRHQHQSDRFSNQDKLEFSSGRDIWKKKSTMHINGADKLKMHIEPTEYLKEKGLENKEGNILKENSNKYFQTKFIFMHNFTYNSYPFRITRAERIFDYQWKLLKDIFIKEASKGEFFTVFTFGNHHQSLLGTKVASTFSCAFVLSVMPMQAFVTKHRKVIPSLLKPRNFLFINDLDAELIGTLYQMPEVFRFQILGLEVFVKVLSLGISFLYYLAQLLSLAHTSLIEIPNPERLLLAEKLLRKTEDVVSFKGLIYAAVKLIDGKVKNMTILSNYPGQQAGTNTEILFVEMEFFQRKVTVDCERRAVMMQCKVDCFCEINKEFTKVYRAKNAVGLQMLQKLGLQPEEKSYLFMNYLSLPIREDMCPYHLIWFNHNFLYSPIKTEPVWTDETSENVPEIQDITKILTKEISVQPFSFMEYKTKNGNLLAALASIYQNSTFVALSENAAEGKKLYHLTQQKNLENFLINVLHIDLNFTTKLFKSPEFLRYQFLSHTGFLELATSVSRLNFNLMLGQILSKSVTSFLQVPSDKMLSIAMVTFFNKQISHERFDFSQILYKSDNHPLPEFKDASVRLAVDTLQTGLEMKVSAEPLTQSYTEVGYIYPWTLVRVDVRNLTVQVNHHFDYQLDGHSRTYMQHCFSFNKTHYEVYLIRSTDGFKIPYGSVHAISLISLLRMGLLQPLKEKLYTMFLQLPLYEDMAPWNIVFSAGKLDYIDYDSKDHTFNKVAPMAYQILAMLMNYERTVKDFGQCKGHADQNFINLLNISFYGNKITLATHHLKIVIQSSAEEKIGPASYKSSSIMTIHCKTIKGKNKLQVIKKSVWVHPDFPLCGQ